MAKDNQRTVYGTIITALIVLIGTILSVCADEKEVLHNRITALELSVLELQSQKALSDHKALDLTYRLKITLRKVDVIKEYIDNLPIPAWIKTKEDDGKFKMLIINHAYEKRYDIKKSNYEGFYDHEVWPEDIATNFYRNDQKVYASKREVCNVEKTIINGKRTLENFCKFPIILLDGTFAVGGVIY